MSRVVAGVTMSLDRFIQDAEGSAGALYPDPAQLKDTDYMKTAQAVAAAGDRAVTVVGGADLTNQLLAAGLVDELRVDVMPVLLGAGPRLSEATGPLALEKLGVDEVGPRTSLRFSVLSRKEARHQ